MNLFFRKRRVRVHFNPVAGPDGTGVELPDFEGILTGKIDGHYLLQAVKVLSSADATTSLDNAVEIPESRVWWLERLAA